MIPKYLEYKLRFRAIERFIDWRTDTLKANKIHYSRPRNAYNDQGSSPLSYSVCFLKMQNMIDTSFMRTFAPTADIRPVQLHVN